MSITYNFQINITKRKENSLSSTDIIESLIEAVDVHVRTLRQKLGEKGDLIQTVRGVGYRVGGE